MLGVMRQSLLIETDPSELVTVVYAPEGVDTITVLKDLRVTVTSRLY